MRAAAEKGEVVVGEPEQEGLAFGQLGRRNRRGALVEALDDREHAVAHLRPVADREPHIAEHARHIGGERVEPSRVADAIDLDVDE